MAIRPKKQMPANKGETGGGAPRGGRGGTGRAKSVEVSPNVTVRAPRGKTISPAEQARLKNISKAPKTTKGKKNALEASGKPSKSKKANTQMYEFQSKDGKLVKVNNTARGFAQEKSMAKNPNVRKRAGFKD